MKNYYDALRRVLPSSDAQEERKKVITELGVVILRAVVECRLDERNRYSYHRSEVKDYARKEEHRIFDALVDFADGKQGKVGLEALLKDERVRVRLRKYREVPRIDFIYDAVKVHALERRDEFEELAWFVGACFVNAVTTHEGVREYELGKEQVRWREMVNIKGYMERELGRRFRYRAWE